MPDNASSHPRGESTYGWEMCLCILAFARTAPLFGGLGAPHTIADHPLPTQQAAHRVLERGLGNWIGLSYDDEVFDAALAAIFSDVALAYGPGVRDRLLAWCRRLFADPVQTRVWGAWSSLFTRLHAVHSHADRELEPPLSLLPHENQAILAAVAAQFERSRYVSDAESVEQVFVAPYDDFEAEVLRWHPAYVRGGESEFKGLPTSCIVALGYQHATMTWRTFDSWMTDDQRRSFLTWANAFARGLAHRAALQPQGPVPDGYRELVAAYDAARRAQAERAGTAYIPDSERTGLVLPPREVPMTG